MTAAPAPTATLQTVLEVAPEIVTEPHRVDLPAEPVVLGEPGRGASPTSLDNVNGGEDAAGG